MTLSSNWELVSKHERSHMIQQITSLSFAASSSWNAVRSLCAMKKHPLRPPVLKMLNAERNDNDCFWDAFVSKITVGNWSLKGVERMQSWSDSWYFKNIAVLYTENTSCLRNANLKRIWYGKREIIPKVKLNFPTKEINAIFGLVLLWGQCQVKNSKSYTIYKKLLFCCYIVFISRLFSEF